MSKWPAGSVYIGNIYYHLMYATSPFPRGLEVGLEGSSTFPTLTVSMLHRFIYLLCIAVFIHLVTIWQGIWAGAAAFLVEFEYYYTVAVLAWCSAHQLLAVNLL